MLFSAGLVGRTKVFQVGLGDGEDFPTLFFVGLINCKRLDYQVVS